MRLSKCVEPVVAMRPELILRFLHLIEAVRGLINEGGSCSVECDRDRLQKSVVRRLGGGVQLDDGGLLRLLEAVELAFGFGPFLVDASKNIQKRIVGGLYILP